MKYKLHDVLALVPLNDDGKAVLKQAASLQKVLNCRIFVLHVIPPISFFTRHFNSGKVKELKDAAMNELADFVSNFYNGEIPENIILKIIAGKLVQTIVKQGQGEDFLFIILKRSSHQKGFYDLLNQHEVDTIIAHSFCPVLSINKNPTPEPIKNILIPTDISEATTKRLLWASMFAKKTGARVQIVSALNINIDEHKSLALKNAEKIKTMLHDRGIDCEVEILKVHGHVKHEMVLSYIAEKKPDFVIIRKHHVSATFKPTIGDFAQEIIHGSNIPVFTVSQSQKDIEQILP